MAYSNNWSPKLFIENKGMIYVSSDPFYYGTMNSNTTPPIEEKLKELGITTIVLLNENESLASWYEEKNINVRRYYIKDFSIPEINDLDRWIKDIDESLKKGEKILIHCKAGIGRTGLIAACIYKRIHGCSGDEAIREIRAIRPGSVETHEQEEMVRSYLAGDQSDRFDTSRSDSFSAAPRTGENAATDHTVTISIELPSMGGVDTPGRSTHTEQSSTRESMPSTREEIDLESGQAIPENARTEVRQSEKSKQGCCILF